MANSSIKRKPPSRSFILYSYYLLPSSLFATLIYMLIYSIVLSLGLRTSPSWKKSYVLSSLIHQKRFFNSHSNVTQIHKRFKTCLAQFGVLCLQVCL